MTANEQQVVMRALERCERCGAENSFRKERNVYERGRRTMQYAKCRVCGAKVKIFFRD